MHELGCGMRCMLLAVLLHRAGLRAELRADLWAALRIRVGPSAVLRVGPQGRLSLGPMEQLANRLRSTPLQVDCSHCTPMRPSLAGQRKQSDTGLVAILCAFVHV